MPTGEATCCWGPRASRAHRSASRRPDRTHGHSLKCYVFHVAERHRRDADGCDRDSRAPHTEQDNSIEQRERLEHQAGGEQQKLDEDFLVALEHGMPPAGGIGIDRLCMMLLGQESIRDVILFPQLKPK
jgi:hypothetical protein